MTPKPTSVRYNDWRQVAVEPLATFTPTLPVSVIIPYYQTPAETLARTLAALERQTYPRDIFEVIIVDDGSEPPLSRPRSTPLDVKVVRQERRGFGAPRARNTGARAAAHNILLFLDSDLLAEADWMAAHARWHHAVSDALTVGFYANVLVDGINMETTRHRPGSLRELFSGRRSDPPWIESHIARTNHLTSRADDLFRVVVSGNLGISKSFYELAGGFNESFTRYGMEDTELGYRAYTHGGLLVPVRDAFTWHQGRWRENRDAKDRSHRLQRGKAMHLIPHPGFRGKQPGRIFKVPQYVVTIDAGVPPDEVVRAVVDLLADRVHDLVVRIETPNRDDVGRLQSCSAPPVILSDQPCHSEHHCHSERSEESPHGGETLRGVYLEPSRKAQGDNASVLSDDGQRLQYLREVFGSDPRVLIAPTRSALDEFPASPFHVTLPAAVFAKDLVHRLRARLGSAVTAAATLPDGSTVSITRVWALHRARRTGKRAADFGEARTIPAKALKLQSANPVIPSSQPCPSEQPTGRSEHHCPSERSEESPHGGETLRGVYLERSRKAQGDMVTYGMALPTKWDTLLHWMRDIRSPGEAWALLKGLALAVQWRVAIKR